MVNSKCTTTDNTPSTHRTNETKQQDSPHINKRNGDRKEGRHERTDDICSKHPWDMPAACRTGIQKSSQVGYERGRRELHLKEQETTK